MLSTSPLHAMIVSWFFLHVGIWYGDSGAHISESVTAIGAMAGTLHIVVSMCECVSWATAHDLRWRHKL